MIIKIGTKENQDKKWKKDIKEDKDTDQKGKKDPIEDIEADKEGKKDLQGDKDKEKCLGKTAMIWVNITEIRYFKADMLNKILQIEEDSKFNKRKPLKNSFKCLFKQFHPSKRPKRRFQ